MFYLNRNTVVFGFVCTQRAFFLPGLSSGQFYIQVPLKVNGKPTQTDLKVNEKGFKVIMAFLLMITKLNWPEQAYLTNAKIYFII